MNSRAPDVSSSKDQTQGRIVTENPALLALLQDNSMDKPVRRVYVDSPVLAQDDEEKYKYISPEVDAFDEIQDHALQDSETARGYIQPQETVSLHHPKEPALQQVLDRHTDGTRYEDHNMRGNRYSTGNENYVVDTEFVIRSREGDKRDKPSSRGSFQSIGPPPVQPVGPLLKPMKQEEEADDRTLEEEREYQDQLKERICEQAVQVERTEVPRLPIDYDSDDSADAQPVDSLDFTGKPGPHDSLEDDSDRDHEKLPQPVAHMGPAEWGHPKGNKNQTPGTEYPSLIAQLQQENAALQQQQNQLASDPWAQSSLQQQDLSKIQLETKLQQEQLEKEKLHVQLQQKELDQQRMQQDMQRQQQQLFLQQQQQLQTMMMMSQPAMMMAAGQVAGAQVAASQPQVGQPVQQQVHPETIKNAPAPTSQNQAAPVTYAQEPFQPEITGPEQGIYNDQYPNQQAYVDPQEEYYSQYEADTGQTSQNDTLDEASIAGDSAIIRRIPKDSSPRNDVDYVELNKQVIQTGRPQKSYGQILHKKNDIKQSTAAIAPVPKLKNKNTGHKKPPLPSRNVVPQSMPASAIGEHVNADEPTLKPASAEHLWQMRSQSLAQRKEDRLGKKASKVPATRGSRQKVPLQKSPSESRVLDLQRSQAADLPYQQSPSMPQRSMAEPIRALTDGTDVHNVQGRPIRHTVMTEDGQHVSVDINLKVLSPTPQPHAFVQQSPNAVVPQHQAQYQGSPPGQRQAMLPAHQMPLAQHSPPRGPPQQPRQAFTQPSPQHQLPQQQYRPPQPQTYSTHVFGSPRQPQVHGYQESAPYVGTGVVYEQGYGGQELGQPAAADPRLVSPASLSSPYRVLPPIGSADTDQGRPYYSDQEHYTHGEPISPRAEDQGSYMDQFHRQKNRKINYKTYTLKDYKSLKREVKLGGLGPDVDTETYRERKEKKQRQAEYAQQIAERNRTQSMKPGRPPRPQQEVEPPPEEEDDMLHRRRVALEYAKSVPKPKVVSRRPELQSPQSQMGKRASQRTTTTHGLSAEQHRDLDLIDLQRLQQRHEQERQQVAMIRHNLDQTVSPRA